MNGTFIFNQDTNGRLSECFLSDVRDLMIKYRVHNFDAKFSNEDAFAVKDMNLKGDGCGYFGLNYEEVKKVPSAPIGPSA
jgi:hypothetical protein